jgi:hypothetical protein
MDQSFLQSESTTLILSAIRKSLANADKVVGGWHHDGPQVDEEELVAYYVENAFIETLVFLESAGLKESFRLVETLNGKAKKSYADAYEYEGELYLKWSEKLRHYLDAIQHMFGERNAGAITNTVSEILRGCAYVITDQRLFPNTPSEEADIHIRIEGILRAVFPDVRTKPPVAKPIKNFEPDTGLPSIKALIEYKYIENKADAKLVSDQVLADTRGYTSKDWNQFIYVIYETHRIESEKKWNQHLQECGVADNTSVIVLQGETPRRTNRDGKKRSRHRS